MVELKGPVEVPAHKSSANAPQKQEAGQRQEDIHRYSSISINSHDYTGLTFAVGAVGVYS